MATKDKTKKKISRRCALPALLAAASGLPWAAHGAGFGDPEGLHGYFDTTLSYGASWRLQKRSPALVGVSNGGLGSNNGDDGNLNYERGELIASLLKSTHELDLNYEKFGFFGRAYLFYDFENANRRGPGPVVGGNEGAGYAFGSQANKRIGRGHKFLDAYLKTDFEWLEGKSTQLRLGSQVVSWGESTFIPGGINAINPIDLTRLRSPGSELKEALLPTPMLWVSQQLVRNISAEAFAIGKFNKTLLEPRGAFFSTTDLVSDDGGRLYLGGPDQHFPAVPGASRWIDRAADRNARASGEYGLALRILAPELNNTEFGLYHINYHHRTPIVSARRGGLNVAGVPVPINAPTQTPTSGAANFFVEYPQSVRLYGLSFNTAGPWSTAWQGEYSYRSNLPLQLAVGEVTNAALGLRNSLSGDNAAANAVAVGTEISGYRRVKMHQLQLSVSKSLSATLGADQVLLIGEAGYTRLELPAGVFFAGYGETTPAGSFAAPASGAGQGFATKNSWGYTLNASADYNNAIGPLRLSPRASFSHAVHGVSPTWNQGVKSASVGLAATYKEQWRADLGYTAFFGGRIFNNTLDTNSIRDRNFIAASISWAL